jgi:hypothetical protein
MKVLVLGLSRKGTLCKISELGMLTPGIMSLTHQNSNLYRFTTAGIQTTPHGRSHQGPTTLITALGRSTESQVHGNRKAIRTQGVRQAPRRVRYMSFHMMLYISTVAMTSNGDTGHCRHALHLIRRRVNSLIPRRQSGPHKPRPGRVARIHDSDGIRSFQWPSWKWIASSDPAVTKPLYSIAALMFGLFVRRPSYDLAKIKQPEYQGLLRQAYLDHYAHIGAITPKDRLLEFKSEDG